MKTIAEITARFEVVTSEIRALSRRHQAGLSTAEDLGDLIRLSVELETLRWVVR